ncbi:MAG: hypothetical protein ACKVH8_02060 [Pirellulales bacterium]
MKSCMVTGPITLRTGGASGTQVLDMFQHFLTLPPRLRFLKLRGFKFWVAAMLFWKSLATQSRIFKTTSGSTLVD